ncbi:hypothetical protein M3Y97_00590400 [Aphelenchoides bicaudatus]|nr:hypothetical protein M3Y97_00590400 [Aphelenchoides bicaudatus]
MSFDKLLFIVVIVLIENAHSGIFYHPSINRLELPLAPYNVKMFCRSGFANKSSTSTPVLCPSASTTCGYLAIPWDESSSDKTVIYECIDSSVFMGEEHEGTRDVYYSHLCSHQSRCQKMPMFRLNPQFLAYLEQTYNLKPEKFVHASTFIKFCCSNNHNSLDELLESNLTVLPINGTPIKCDDRQCLPGAIGCMSHKKEKFDEPAQTLQNHDYGDIHPVEIEIVWEDSVIDEYVTPANVEPETNDDDHLHCVYPHFNDEVYRYCLMIKAQQAGPCWSTRGHRICCCFVENDQETCTPLEDETLIPMNTQLITQSTTTTTTEMTKIRSNIRRKNSRQQVRKKKCQKSSLNGNKTINCEEQPIRQSLNNAFKLTGSYLFSVVVMLFQLNRFQ